MKNLIGWFQGKKTHLLVLGLVLLQLFNGGAGAEGFNLTNIDAGNLQQMFLTALISTVKAAWDRKNPA